MLGVSRALFTSAFMICTLYAFIVSGAAPATAVFAASSAVVALMAFPLIVFSACVALTGIGATPPSVILASLQSPSLIVMTEATLTMAKSIAFLNLNLRKACLAPSGGVGI